jgi:hypothetical protein
VHTLSNVLLGGWIFLYIGVIIGQLIGTNPQAVAGTALIMAVPWVVGLVILWAWKVRIEKKELEERRNTPSSRRG